MGIIANTVKELAGGSPTLGSSNLIVKGVSQGP